jgi:hypothetical protein
MMGSFRTLFFLICILAYTLLGVWGGPAQEEPAGEDAPPPAEESFSGPVGFLGLHIGMTREQVLSAADSNELIEVPRNRDVDFFPVEERKILTLSVEPYVPFIYLQFFDEVLYSITVIFDEKYMDYYTLSEALADRYGAYSSLTPQWRRWSLDRVTVKVEKPAVVKYIALEDFLEAASFDGRLDPPDMDMRRALLEGL